MADIPLDLQFDAISYLLIAALLALVIAPVVLSKDPDIHPYALLRQSLVSPVRNPRESAVYRSVQTPFQYPLVAGLGLPTEQKYSTRNGDIRDIWKLAVEKSQGKVLSVKGKELREHDLHALTKDIHALGSHLKQIEGIKSVAIYLPNDVENLVVSFACAFYGIKLTILPFDPKGVPSINALLRRISPDVVVAPAGLFPLADLEGVPLKQVIFVVEQASQHLDWSAPNTKSLMYHEIVQNEGIEGEDVDIDVKAPSLVMCGPKGLHGEIEIVEFSHRNIIAAVASQLASLPKNEKYGPEDVFIPVDTLSDLYTRIHTYAAMASGATVALNPTASKTADLEVTVRNVNPTIIVASPNTLAHVHKQTTGAQIEMWHGLIHWFQTRTLTVHGQIPKGNFWTKVNDYPRPAVGDRLRIIFSAEACDDPESVPLNSGELSDLRAYFGCKVVYGLKHHSVAGPITQWNLYDYRVQEAGPVPPREPRRCAHFGAVTPSVEVKLRDYEDFTADDKDGPRGEIVVAGPTVASEKWEVALGVVGKWHPEGVLSYAA